jgi:hypothetical protein
MPVTFELIEYWVGGDALLHLRHAQTRVLPDHRHHRNVDLREDVLRHDRDGRDAQKHNQRREDVEGVRGTSGRSELCPWFVLTSLDNTTCCGHSACRQPQRSGGPGRLLDCGLGRRVARMAVPANTASPRAGGSEGRQAPNLRRNERPHGCQPRESGGIRDGRNKVRSSGERFATEWRFHQTKRSF